MRGSKRCRLHGGLSTGPSTPEGKARTAAAMKAGHAPWLAKLKSEGKPIPFGRRKGGHNPRLEFHASSPASTLAASESVRAADVRCPKFSNATAKIMTDPLTIF